MALNKFWKRKDLQTIESQVGTALAEVENSSTEWKSALKSVLLSSVRDVTKQINARKPVYLVFIPYPCLKAYLKVSKKLVAELERRLKVTVLVVAKRAIESKWIKHHRSQKRPQSRTLTNVYDELLEDLCTPASIIGRRTRVRVDGTRYYKIFLDQSDKEIEGRLEAIHDVYKALTTREVQFEWRQDYTFFELKQKKKNTQQQ